MCSGQPKEGEAIKGFLSSTKAVSAAGVHVTELGSGHGRWGCLGVAVLNVNNQGSLCTVARLHFLLGGLNEPNCHAALSSYLIYPRGIVIHVYMFYNLHLMCPVLGLSGPVS